ncbi:MAG: hypothetical protein CMM52_01400 [Rhodospirillaceae bacterium]|nr:hypothetical protein [Rhodospirillaceae bacterium]|tara:strand:+ start:27292 stop:27969 length:678 start_codon:yes stop_codon:yes gene_type:complete
MERKTPLFVHIIGLEGCGHHGLYPVMGQAIVETHGGDEFNRFYRSGLRNAFDGIWCRNYSKRDCIRGALHFLEKVPRDTIILEDNSYPSGKYREVQHQWDFVEFYDFLKEHCEIRFALLNRNIFNLVNSRREFDDGLKAHALKMAEIGNFINERISALEAKGVPVTRLDYDFLESQTAEIGALIDCPAEAVDTAMKEQFKKSTKDYRETLSDQEIQDVKDAFDIN